MRKSLLLLATLGPLAAVAAIAVPAIAQSGGGAAVTQPESIPLFADPAPTPDQFAGRGDDEEDDVAIPGKATGQGSRLLIEADDNGPWHESGQEDND